MLVLTRKPLEAILIGNDIKITVVEIRGNTVKLGFEAPKEVPIIRTELIETTKPPEVPAA